jgi:hypothetical protein
LNLALALTILGVLPLPLPLPLQDAPAAAPAIEKKTVSASGVSVHYLTVPWGPNTFAAMERGGESYYAKRTWPFARLQATKPFTIEGAKVPAGNYALVFHPNTPDQKGMSLEVRKIAVEEFLVAGNVMTKTPEGEAVATIPAVFETVPETASALGVELKPAAAGSELVLRYGDRRLRKALSY